MRSAQYFRGWEVVAACFVMAAVSWGFGFYGTGVYLAYLTGERGLPISAVSGGLTAYFWLSAVLIMTCGAWLDRAGPRVFVSVGTLALMLSVCAIARVQALWHFYLALAAMAISWTTMTSSAINTILAPWFMRKRGLALSIALTGASFGGIAVIPLITAATHAYGQRAGLEIAGLSLGCVVLLVAWRSFARDPSAVGQYVDGDAAPPTGHGDATTQAEAEWSMRRILASRAFLSTALPFALGLMIQVGFLTHQIAMLQPRLGRTGAAWAVGLTTVCAVVGRLIAGASMDRLERRALAALNFGSQAAGLSVLAQAESVLAIHLACVLCGLAVGNMITFQSLLIQREFPVTQFNRVNRLALGIGQAVYACGPLALGFLRQLTGSYVLPLYGSAAVAASSALVVWFVRPR